MSVRTFALSPPYDIPKLRAKKKRRIKNIWRLWYEQICRSGHLRDYGERDRRLIQAGQKGMISISGSTVDYGSFIGTFDDQA